MSEFTLPGDIVVDLPDVPTIAMEWPEGPDTLVVPVPGLRGLQGEPGTPGDAVVQHEHTQSTPASVWGPIVHNLGRRPSAVSLFSLDFSEQYGQFNVQHLDEDSLRISVDTPTAGVALLS